MTSHPSQPPAKADLNRLAESCKQKLHGVSEQAKKATQEASDSDSLGSVVGNVAQEAPNYAQSLQTFICEVDRHDPREVDRLLKILAVDVQDVSDGIKRRQDIESMTIFFNRRAKVKTKRDEADSFLKERLAWIKRTIGNLQSLPLNLTSNSNTETSLSKRAIARKRQSHRRESVFMSAIDAQIAKQETVLSIGEVEPFWNEIPLREDVSHHVGRRDNPGDGLVYEQEDRSKTGAALVELGKALNSAKHPLSNSQLDLLQNMSSICLILKHMQVPHYIDRFLFCELDDKSLGMNKRQAFKIFCGNCDSADRECEAHDVAETFVNEQYRAIERPWGESPHLPNIPDGQPLPFRVSASRGRLGSGSYCEVWAVENAFNKGEKYAHKTLRVHDTDGQKFKDNHRRNATRHLEDEIRQLMRLGRGPHLHIVSYYRSYKRGLDFGILETLADDNLDEMLLNCQNNPELRRSLRSSLVRAIGCLSRGLNRLHYISFTRHRDIKPANIVHTWARPKDGKHEDWLWADFGRAYGFDEQLGSQTNTGLKFSKAYAPPEIMNMPSPMRDNTGGLIPLEHSETHGRRSDIYSFGIVILEVLSVLMGERYRLYQGESWGDNDGFKRLHPWHSKIEATQAWAEDQIKKLDDNDPMVLLFELAIKMIASKQMERPTVAEVIRTLSRDKSTYFCHRCIQELEAEGL